MLGSVAKALIALCLAVAGMSYAESHLFTLTPETVTSGVSAVVDPLAAAGKRANAAQCESIRLSTGSDEYCAVMMTPAELAAAASG